LITLLKQLIYNTKINASINIQDKQELPRKRLLFVILF